MSATTCLSALGLAACGPNSTMYRDAPVASALIVHLCGVAEAQAHLLRSGSRARVKETDITLKMTGQDELAPAFGIGTVVSGVTAGKRDVGAEKDIQVNIEGLPSLRQCVAWGYRLRLGNDGCLEGAGGGDPSSPAPCVPATSLPVAPSGCPASAEPNPAAPAASGAAPRPAASSCAFEVAFPPPAGDPGKN